MSFIRSPPNVLLVSQDTMQNMDGGEALAGLWFLFTKCKSSLADGGRLENVSWRLWHREFTSVATTLKSSSFNPDLSINEKASPSQSRSHSRPLTPESTNGSDKSSVYTDEKSAIAQQETSFPQRTHRKIGQVIWDVSNSPPLPPSTMRMSRKRTHVPAHAPPIIAESRHEDLASSLPTPDVEKESMSSIAVEVVPPPADPIFGGSIASGPTSVASRATTAPSSRSSTAPPSRSGTAPSTPLSASRVGSPNTSLYPRLVIVNPTPHPTPPATPVALTNGNGHLLDVSVQGNSLRPPVAFGVPSEPISSRNDTIPKGIFFVPDTKDKGSGSSSSGSSSGSSALSTTMASTTTVTAVVTPFLLPAAPIIERPAGKIASAERITGKQPATNEVATAGKDDPTPLSSDDGDETQVEEDQDESQKRVAEEAQKNRKKPSALRATRSKSRGRDFSGHGGAAKRFGGGRGHAHTRKDSSSKFQVGSGDSGSRSKSPAKASRVQPTVPARAQQLKPKFNVGSDSASPNSPQVSPARPSPPAMVRHVSAPVPPKSQPKPPPQISRVQPEPGNKVVLPRAASSRTGLGGMNLRMTAANPAPSNLRATATRTEPPTRNSSQTNLHRALPLTTTVDGLAAAAALVQKQQEDGGNRGRVELTSESDDSSTEEEEDDEEWTSATGSEGEEVEPEAPVQEEQQPPPPPPPLMRRQTTITNVSRMQRAKSAAGALTQEEKLKQAALEAQRQRDMFVKLPKRSYSNLNRTGSGLLTQLMNPDPEIFPVNHPYRRGHSTGDVDSTGGAVRAPLAAPSGLTLLKEANEQPPPPIRAPALPAPAPTAAPAQRPPPLRKTSTASSRGFLMPSLTSKVAVAGPVAAQVHAGSVSRQNVQKHSREVSNGYRPKGRPESQEMESSDEEEEDNKAVGNLSQSVAQQRLQALAQRRGASSSSSSKKGKGVASPQEQLPPWAVDDDLPPSPEEITAATPMPTSARPIQQLSYPYNLPQHAEPSTPRTTRQLMLRTEMSESVRQNLLWQRHMSKADMLGPQRRSSANIPSMLTRSNPQNKSVVEVRPKASRDTQKQSVENERREVEEFVTGRKSSTNLAAEEESSDRLMLGTRPPISRHKSWAYQDR